MDLIKQFEFHNHDGQNSLLILQTVWANASLPGTQSATASNYGIFFIASRPCTVKRISEVHTVAGSNASAVTLQVERLQGTEALDAGDTLLSTAFNLKGTANTVQTGSLINTGKTILSLSVGDRLALKDSGTLTDVAGVCVSVEINFK